MCICKLASYRRRRRPSCRTAAAPPYRRDHAGGFGTLFTAVAIDLGILVNGSEVTTPVSVVYTGNGDQPFARSDFNFDGSINGTDYEILRANQFVTLTETTAVASYAKGDVNGDLRNDVNDFRLFKADYIAANGPGSFAALVGVPEPSTILLALGGLAGIAALRRQR